MKSLFESFVGFAFFILALVLYFPGGTILMATQCNSHRLNGWDWVLSVIIPGYGLFKALFSSAC